MMLWKLLTQFLDHPDCVSLRISDYSYFWAACIGLHHRRLYTCISFVMSELLPPPCSFCIRVAVVYRAHVYLILFTGVFDRCCYQLQLTAVSAAVMLSCASSKPNWLFLFSVLQLFAHIFPHLFFREVFLYDSCNVSQCYFSTVFVIWETLWWCTDAVRYFTRALSIISVICRFFIDVF